MQTNANTTSVPFETPSSLQSRAGSLPAVPWWSELDQAMLSQLELPSQEVSPTDIFDVIVIGGGVTGLSAAISARSTGASVLLLEKEAHLGLGATGRNAGILSAGINMSISEVHAETVEAAFWPETTRLLHELIEEAKQPGSLLRTYLTGALSLAESMGAAARLRREVRARLELGLRAETWTPAQVREHTEDRLSTEDVQEAMWLPDEGRIQPLTLLAHLACKARNVDVQMIGNASVTSYTEEISKHCWKVTLADGRKHESRALIKAVGPTVQANARIYALSFAIDLPDNFPLFWDAAPYTYCDYRPGPGHITTSGGRYGKAGNTSRDKSFYTRLAAATCHWLPELEGQQPIYAWGVDLKVSPSMIPTLKPLGKRLSGFSIEGLGALGVLPGVLLGRRAGVQVLVDGVI